MYTFRKMHLNFVISLAKILHDIELKVVLDKLFLDLII